MNHHTRIVRAAIAAGVVTVGVIAHNSARPAPSIVEPTIPGAYFQSVTQRTIRTTICVSGWTGTVRPAANVTGRIKRDLMRSQNAPGSPAAYELDHLVPLELGGAPSDLNNLWIEPIDPARITDREENRLKREVCAGRMDLASARVAIVAWKHQHG